jgi:hypothetical protein
VHRFIIFESNPLVVAKRWLVHGLLHLLLDVGTWSFDILSGSCR